MKSHPRSQFRFALGLVLLIGCQAAMLAGCSKNKIPDITPIAPPATSATSATAGTPETTGTGGTDTTLSGQTAGSAAPIAALAPVTIPPAPAGTARAFILVDALTGQTLAAANEHERQEPASLTKLMTSYVVFDALHSGRLRLDDNVTISEHAWRVGGASSDGSTSFLPLNSQVPVEILLQGMTVQSGNDASIALAERVGGTEDTFAQLMNEYAKKLGMKESHFLNATGLPAPEHYVTAYDIALLGAALVHDFPQYYHYYSEREFTYNGIKQHNRNGLLERDPSVDGMKTGHTESAGYCLVSSAKRNDMRLVSVVLGTQSIKSREDQSEALLNYGFNFYETRQLYAANTPLVKVRVWQGRASEANVGLKDDVKLTLPRGQASAAKPVLDLPTPVLAPLQHDKSIGKLKVMLGDKELASRDLYPTTDVAAAGFFGRLSDKMSMWFN